jgi:hypothetical protein
MLVVMDSVSDPIPGANKVLNISQLVPNEKRVTLKNLHLVDVVPEGLSFLPFHFNKLQVAVTTIRLHFERWSKLFTMGLVLPKDIAKQLLRDRAFRGFRVEPLDRAQVDRLRDQWIESEYKNADSVERYIGDLDFEHLFVPNSKTPVLKIDNRRQGRDVNALVVAMNERPSRSHCRFSIIQEDPRGRIEGGSTFLIRNRRGPR